MRLKNILIVVQDIERSKEFYRDLFGLHVIMDQGENAILSEGLVLQEKTAWENYIGYKPGDVTWNSELFFVETDLDRFLKKTKELGMEKQIRGDVRTNFLGKRTVHMQDPDGHLIEIGEN